MIIIFTLIIFLHYILNNSQIVSEIDITLVLEQLK